MSSHDEYHFQEESLKAIVQYSVLPFSCLDGLGVFLGNLHQSDF